MPAFSNSSLPTRAYRLADSAFLYAFRFFTKDHLGFSGMFSRMPSMGLLDSLIHVIHVKHDNLPVITRKLRDIAKLAIARMNDETTSGNGKTIGRQLANAESAAK